MESNIYSMIDGNMLWDCVKVFDGIMIGCAVVFISVRAVAIEFAVSKEKSLLMAALLMLMKGQNVGLNDLQGWGKAR